MKFGIYAKKKPVAQVEIKKGYVVILASNKFVMQILRNMIPQPHFLKDRDGTMYLSANQEATLDSILRNRLYKPYKAKEIQEDLPIEHKYMDRVRMYNVD